MTIALPAIYSYSKENINQKIDDMIKIGYSKEDVINITKALPSIFGLRIENIKQKIEYIKQLGYSREEVMNITKALPQIFGLSIENIKQKIEFYDSINLHKLIIENPKQLMQSTALSYARYMFYKDNGIIIDENNYNKLFIGQKVFEQKYGVKKEELLLRYNYKKYIENLRMKNTQELGKETTKEQINTELLDSIEEAQEKQQKAIDHKKEEITN